MAIYEITAPNGQVLEIEGDTPPSEADLDEIFKTTKTIAKPKNELKKPTRPRGIGGYFDKDYQEKLINYENEKIKQQAQDFIDRRNEWEQNHPFISGLQKDFQPGYRSSLTDRETKAKYGVFVPNAELGKSLGKQYLQEAIPGANITAATLTGGESFLPGLAEKGFLGQLGRGAAQGAIQMGTLGGTHELGDNGLSLNVVPETLKGAALGGTIGGAIPLVAEPGKRAIQWLAPRAAASLGGVTTDTVEQAVKPNSKALDMNADQAKALLLDTTSNIRNAYNNLVDKTGNTVQEAVNKLRGNTHRIPTKHVLEDINSTFNQYQGDLVNPARNMTGNLENNLEDIVIGGSKETPIYPGTTDLVENTISPIDLEKAKQQIGSMINWQDEAARNFKNPILEQIYGKFNTRLSNLSPELKQANEAYANLKAFKNNEGLRSVLRAGDSIDSASQTLKNYKSTVTKGNTGRNIQDLENTLVANGEQPFLNTIDDINAAMDLENSLKTGRNFLGATDLAKQFLLRPVLRGARAYNQSPLPRAFYNIKNAGKRLAIPFIYNAPRLFGEVEENNF